MSGLVFDEDSHTYTLNGVRLPSVTTILKPCYDFSAIDPEILARAARFGTAVHRAVELWVNGDLDEDSLDEGLVGSLAAFKAWFTTTTLGINTRHVEKRMAHQRLKFAGTADMIIDGYAIIDIKTRKVNPLTDPLQLAAYEKLWIANGGASVPYHHYVLELRRDGTYQYTRVNHRASWSMFRTLLDYHTMGETIKKWRMK